MDDQKFDQKTAQEWIEVIEAGSGLRDQDIYPRLNSWIEEYKPENILDIGAGQGICSTKISSEIRYTGIEPSSYLIERAIQKYSHPSRTFVKGSVYEMPFQSEVFDAAFSIAVWHLLSDIALAANELNRVLNSGGRFMVITANPDGYDAWRRLYSQAAENGIRFEGSMTLPDGTQTKDVLYLHSGESLLKSFELAELKVLKTETFRTHQGIDMFIAIQGIKA